MLLRRLFSSETRSQFAPASPARFSWLPSADRAPTAAVAGDPVDGPPAVSLRPRDFPTGHGLAVDIGQRESSQASLRPWRCPEAPATARKTGLNGL